MRHAKDFGDFADEDPTAPYDYRSLDKCLDGRDWRSEIKSDTPAPYGEVVCITCGKAITYEPGLVDICALCDHENAVTKIKEVPLGSRLMSSFVSFVYSIVGWFR